MRSPSLIFLLLLSIAQVHGSQVIDLSDDNLKSSSEVEDAEKAKVLTGITLSESDTDEITVPTRNQWQKQDHQEQKPVALFPIFVNKSRKPVVSEAKEVEEGLKPVLTGEADEAASVGAESVERTLGEDDEEEEGEAMTVASVETAHESANETVNDDGVSDQASGDKNDESGEAVSTSLFPHKIGIRNHALNCYASALISCLYNIPMFQAAVFGEVKNKIGSAEMRKHVSPTAALAAIFHKMRFGASFVDLEPHFMPAVTRTTGWEFGNIQCVLDFWNALSKTFSPEISSLFSTELRENHLRKSDNSLIKSVTQKCNMILVSPSPKYASIEELLENNFADEDAEDFMIEPEDQAEYAHLLSETIEERVQISSRTNLNILNCPSVLIFGIKRVRWNKETKEAEFDSSQLGFPEILTINSEKYTIVGNVEYNARRVHYFAQNHDLIDDQWYVHDDKNVEMIADTAEAFEDLSLRFVHNSSMVFYVKSSLLEPFQDGRGTEIDSEVIAFLKSRARSSSTAANAVATRKRTFESIELKVSEPEPLAEKPSVTIEKKATDEKKPARKRTKKATVDTAEAKTATKTSAPKKRRSGEIVLKSDSVTLPGQVRLGSSEFTFNQADRAGIFEAVLTAYAYNRAAARQLIAAAGSAEQSSFLFKFAVTVLKILSGKQGIDVSELKRVLAEEHGVNFHRFYDVWGEVSKLLPQEIAPIPDVTFIRYRLDRPLGIASGARWEGYHIIPHMNIECPAELQLDGVASDHQELNYEEDCYRRGIVNSDGFILPIRVLRLVPNNEGRQLFDTESISINYNGYSLFGFIGVHADSNEVFSLFQDPQNSASRFVYYTQGQGTGEPRNEQSVKDVMRLLNQRSIIVLFTKLEHLKVDYPLLSEVPKALLDELNK